MTPPRLSGACCLITGGSRNLGRALCLAFARAGARVAFTFHSRADDAAETCRLIEAESEHAPLCVQGSVTDAAHARDTVAALVRAWGRLDVLVNNAGAFQMLPIALIEEDDWDHVMNVTAKGAYLFARQALRPMLRQKRGHILNIGVFSEDRAVPMPPHYAAAKAALRGFSQALAQEVGGQGIQVNYLAPGLLDVGTSQRLPASRMGQYVDHCALGHAGAAADIADMATWLVSAENTFMTGARIVADGGVRG
jgi:3-oxoacyl-[acyl-carrier protein] reductase